MSFLLEWTIKTSAVLLIALAVRSVLRGRSAAFRHFMLSLAVVIAAVIPLVSYVLPSWHLTSDSLPAATATTSHEGATSEMASQVSATEPARPLWQRLWFVTWIGGLSLSLLVLLIGAVRLARIAAASPRVVQQRWLEMALSVKSEYGLRQPATLLQSPNPSILVTWGLLKPKIVLPAGADVWSEQRAQMVLRHELAHVRRRDWAIHLIAEFFRAIHWFNPLVWIVCNRMRIESEYACDDAVLSRGVAAPDYAAELLDLARDLNAKGGTWSAALAMARPSTIERRFRAMLNPSVNRQPVTAKVALYVLVVALGGLIPIAMFSSSAAQVSTGGVSGTVVDGSGAAVRSATVIVSTASGQTEVTTTANAAGRYGFANLPVGIHLLQVFAPGFGPSRTANIEVKGGQQSIQDLKMDIGFVAAEEEKPPTSRPIAVTQPLVPQPAARQTLPSLGQGIIKGVVTDPTGAVVPGVEVSLSNDTLQGTRKVITDEAGNFVLDRVPTGPYRVIAALPGFKTVNLDGTLTAQNETVTLSPRLAVSPVAEEITVRAFAGDSSEAQPPETPSQCTALPPALPAQPPMPAEMKTPGRIRQGGNVRTAMLIGQTKPVYPAAAKIAGTQGAVIMQVVIGRDGRIMESKVISGDPVLTSAAVDAVQRWCYAPTKLNGEPVEVVSTVTVNFVLQ